eukprot:gene45270-60464_t
MNREREQAMAVTASRALYTPEQRVKRDQSIWTWVQGVLAPIQFLVFLVSLVLVLRYLATEGLSVAAQDLYDTCPRRVHYFPLTGRVMVKRLASANDTEVLASE